jgi:hypothetical protein
LAPAEQHHTSARTETSAMKNMTMRVVDNKLVIEVDLTQDVGPSKSGKTVLIATTEGNADCPGREDIKIGLNVYRYPEKK